jgi:hypothetical protein
MAQRRKYENNVAYSTAIKLLCFRRLLMNTPLWPIAIHHQCWNCEYITHLNLPVALHLPTYSTKTNKEFTAELKKANFILHELLVVCICYYYYYYYYYCRRRRNHHHHHCIVYVQILYTLSMSDNIATLMYAYPISHAERQEKCSHDSQILILHATKILPKQKLHIFPTPIKKRHFKSST